MSTTEFRVRTSTSDRLKKLTRKTDVVITLVPSLGDGESVMSNTFVPIPWKILTFQANSNTCHLVTIHSEIAVCTVKEKENGILTPQFSAILTKGSEIVLERSKGDKELEWNRGLNAEQTELASANDNFMIKNECEDARLALCLIDDFGERLPIVDLGILPEHQTFTINGRLFVQAYAISEQKMGKPLESMTCAPLLGPMAVADLPQTPFMLYTRRDGVTKLE